MTTDLQGRQLGSSPVFELSLWQKRQAAVLYHIASQGFLESLIAETDEMVAWVNAVLEERTPLDPYMASERWGVRDTAANWSTHVHPALVSFRDYLVEERSLRTIEQYGPTSNSNVAGMLRNFSLRWTTQEQEAEFNRRIDSILRSGRDLNDLVDRPSRRTDFILDRLWLRYAAAIGSRPSFRIRADIEVSSGQHVRRTGVYVPKDDPLGTLQFAWTGGERGALSETRTFNELGREALQAIGRHRIWQPCQASVDFVRRPDVRARLEDHQYMHGDEPDPDLVPSAIARHAFESRPCDWYYVEMIPGEYEEDPGDEPADADNIRLYSVPAGQPCPRGGFWFTQAGQRSRRRFEQGSVFPNIDGSAYGDTYWQWSNDQEN